MNEQNTTGESNNGVGQSGASENQAQSGRQRSTIGFPYAPLTDAESLTKAIHGNVGHGHCSLQQMAAWTSQSVKSSTFRVHVAAARMFGLVGSDGVEAYYLTPLGRRLCDPATERAAKVEAFLEVPLFSAVFDKYKDGVVPPSAALEREIESLGVAKKQKSRARQVLEKSAEHAGFYEHGRNKLVKPGISTFSDSGGAGGNEGSGGGGNGGGGSGDGGVEGINLDPLLMALLQKIPPSDEPWPAEKRLRWFKTFAMNVSQVYDDELDDNPVELNITLNGNKAG